MDFGEQTTGTRDEHYNLVSVLYHALHGAETIETYLLDAEAAGDERSAAFFKEAQATQMQLAERAKGLLGIGGEVTPEAAGSAMVAGAPPETEVPSDTGPADVRGRTAPEVGLPPEGRGTPDAAPSDVAPRSADVQREPNVPADELGATAEEVPPTTDVPRTSGTTTPPPDEDLVAETGAVAPDAPAKGEDVATPAEAPRSEVLPPDAPREAPPAGEERPERRREAPATDTPREDPPPGEERPERRTP